MYEITRVSGKTACAIVNGTQRRVCKRKNARVRAYTRIHKAICTPARSEARERSASCSIDGG